LERAVRKSRIVFSILSLQDLEPVLGEGWWLVIFPNGVHSLVGNISTVELVYDKLKRVR
jgi:hypothetical protein